jgi:hypothetical protein
VTDPTPIRDGILPEVDVERELADYLIGRLSRHREHFKEPADTIAIVTMSDKGRSAHSFTMKPEGDKLGTCSAAAAMLLDRAIKGD